MPKACVTAMETTSPWVPWCEALRLSNPYRTSENPKSCLVVKPCFDQKTSACFLKIGTIQDDDGPEPNEWNTRRLYPMTDRVQSVSQMIGTHLAAMMLVPASKLWLPKPSETGPSGYTWESKMNQLREAFRTIHAKGALDWDDERWYRGSQLLASTCALERLAEKERQILNKLTTCIMLAQPKPTQKIENEANRPPLRTTRLSHTP